MTAGSLWRSLVGKREITAAEFILTIALTLVMSWFVTLKLGGAGVVAPHWFYIPIMLCAYRFGFLPTLVVSAISGFLVGPIMPDHFTNGMRGSSGHQ